MKRKRIESTRTRQRNGTVHETGQDQDAFRALYNDACDAFLKMLGPSSLGGQLTALRSPLRREGMRLALSLVHGAAFATITSLLVQRGLINSDAAKVLPKSTALDAVFKPFSSEAKLPDVDLETLALVANRAREEQALRGLFQLANAGTTSAALKATFLAFTFPDRYVEGIVEGLVQARRDDKAGGLEARRGVPHRVA